MYEVRNRMDGGEKRMDGGEKWDLSNKGLPGARNQIYIKVLAISETVVYLLTLL